jgi:hypothetical protein
LEYYTFGSMPLGEYDPVAPSKGDCIVCIEGDKGRLILYLEQEGSVPTILSKGKSLYKKAMDGTTSKIAAYYVDSIETARLFGIDA